MGNKTNRDELDAEALRSACEKAWDEGADSVSYDPESRDFLTQPENPYREGGRAE